MKRVIVVLISLTITVTLSVNSADANPPVVFLGGSPGPDELFESVEVDILEKLPQLLDYLRLESIEQNTVCFFKSGEPLVIQIEDKFFRVLLKNEIKVYSLKWENDRKLLQIGTFPIVIEGYPERRWEISILLGDSPSVLTIH